MLSLILILRLWGKCWLQGAEGCLPLWAMHTCSAVALTAPRWSLSTCFGPAQGGSSRSEIRLSRLWSHATGAAGLSQCGSTRRGGAFWLPDLALPGPTLPNRAPGSPRAVKLDQIYPEERGASVRVSRLRAPREPVTRAGGGRNLSSRAAVGRRRPEPFFSRRLLAGGGVQSRNGPPAAGFVQRSPAADVGRPGTGCRCGALWR